MNKDFDAWVAWHPERGFNICEAWGPRTPELFLRELESEKKDKKWVFVKVKFLKVEDDEN